MLSAFVALRSLFLALFVLLKGGILAGAAIALSSATRDGPLRPVEIYLMFSSAASILFVFPIILVDVLRRGALTSKVWFECLWLFVAWILNLCGAAAITALAPQNCTLLNQSSCSSARMLMGVTWAVTLLVLGQFTLILVSSIHYCKRFPDVWRCSVRDFQWWAGGGSGEASQLHSGPPSPSFVPRQLSLNPSNPVPHLEKLAQTWQPPVSHKVQVTVQAMNVPMISAHNMVVAQKFTAEPQPLTLAYAPEPAPKAPAHYNATAVFSVGVLPQRNPTKKMSDPSTSFYSTTVQSALQADKAKRGATIPPSHTRQASSTSSSEPLPIKNWPRVNPADPFKKARTAAAAPVVASRMSDDLPHTVPANLPAPATSTSTRRSRGPRQRPPPLDLSLANPNRLR